jgi:RNA polymerase sigma-70 factor (ECF subfamily)
MDVVNDHSPPTRLDAPQLEGLIAQHQASVWRYLRALGCDSSLADDLTQETFLAVYSRPFEQINDAATSFYLRRVAYHLLISHRRRHKRMTLTDQVEFLEQDWMRWAGFDSGEAALEHLAECFRRLTDRAQLSLTMRFQKQASREEIAEALGITPHGAKNLMQRAKTQLKDCVESKLK